MAKTTGKTIRIYLADGKPSGLLITEIMGWTGRVYQIPRTLLPSLAKNEDLEKTGIYILSGPSEANPNKEKVYIGEGDNLFKRLAQHEKNEKKDFWNKATAVISKDENLTKSHVRYLESRLVEVASKAKRAEVGNSNSPRPKALPKPDVDYMESFLEQVLLILPILGLSFAKPTPGSQETQPDSPTFEYNSVGTHATAQEIDGEFVVFKGSTARKQGTASWKSYKSLRDQLVKEKKLIDLSKEYYQFSENVGFASPSAAAAVVYAGNQNGRKKWKLKGTRKTYKQWQEELLEQL